MIHQRNTANTSIGPEYLPYLTMRCVLSTAAAVFIQFKPPGIVSAIFLRQIITLFALGTRHGHYVTDTFLTSHNLPTQ